MLLLETRFFSFFSGLAAIPLALLCLGLILLAIAATIILSLIPIYTSAKGSRVPCSKSLDASWRFALSLVSSE